MDITQTSDIWWKNSVFYCLDVETFQDGNGDGIGDFVGLAQRVDYLAGLGVNCVWLMPFYPTPNRDDGYDIVDYYQGLGETMPQEGDIPLSVRNNAFLKALDENGYDPHEVHTQATVHLERVFSRRETAREGLYTGGT